MYLVDNDDKGTSPVKKVRDHSGERNPHFGHSMSDDSRKRISTSQSLRYEAIRQLINNGMQKPITEDRVREIIQETINDYLSNNAIQTKNNKPTNITLG